MTTTAAAKTKQVSPSDRRILGIVLSLSVLLIGTNGAISMVMGRVDTALKRGDWPAADRLQIFWKYASPKAARAALLQSVRHHDCYRARLILSHCPAIQLLPFVRQQIGDYDAEVMNPADLAKRTVRSNEIEDPKMLVTLLENGADANAPLPSDVGDPTKSMLGALLLLRSRMANPQHIQKSVEMESILRNHGARMSLFDSARFGDATNLTQLLDQGADPNSQDWMGKPLLYLAAQNNQVETARILVQHGAEIDSTGRGVTRSARDTPLMVAERKGHIRFAELLIEAGASTHLDAHAVDGYRAVPLVPAAAFGDMEHMRFLLAHGARCNESASDGGTALMFACMKSDVSVPVSPLQTSQRLVAREERQANVVNLLIHKECSINARDNSGRTALMQAVWSERLCRILIANGANVNIADNAGFSPLAAAVHGHNLNVVRLLMHSGAYVNSEDRLGNTAYGIALDESGRNDRKSSQATRLLNTLRTNGAHLSLRESALIGDEPEFRWGLSHRAVRDLFTRRHAPLLMAAVHGGNVGIVQELLKAGAPVDAANPRGWTALMVAASDGRQGIVKLMVDHGARKDLRTRGGETARQIARRRNHGELLPLLQ